VKNSICYICDRFNHKLGQLKFVLSALVTFIALDPTAATSSDRQLDSLASRVTSTPVKIAKRDSVLNSKGKLPTADGIYLYGQSPQTNQLGQEYMIFEMQQGKVTGALYLPQSEFSCFEGSLKSDRLSVTVAADANSEADAAQVAAVGNSQIEDDYSQISSPYAVGLQNYYQLQNITDNDRRILTACQHNNRQ
jgi:hypothetical protein